jgi:hypothetical protein
MVIPGDERGAKAAQGTGCGTDSEEMWILDSTASGEGDAQKDIDNDSDQANFPSANTAALALGRSAQILMNMDAAMAEKRSRLKGCGWLNLTHVETFGDVSTAASQPRLYMYTDSKGWVISNRVFDVESDPGPGIVFASSYRSPLLDYCDGAALGTADSATTTVSYSVEPLEFQKM